MKKRISISFLVAVFSLFLPFLLTVNDKFETINLLGFQYIWRYSLWLYFVVLALLLVIYQMAGGNYQKYKKIVPFFYLLTLLAAYVSLPMSYIINPGPNFKYVIEVFQNYELGYYASFGLFLLVGVLLFVSLKNESYSERYSNEKNVAL